MRAMRTIIATIESNKSGDRPNFHADCGSVWYRGIGRRALRAFDRCFFLFLPRESGSSQSIGER